MSKLSIKTEKQKQSLLFPPTLEELIPSTHVVRIVNEIIERLNIENILVSYRGGGNSCYSPKMMLKILVYSYLNNVYSCRKIEQQLHENINFMWLSGMSYPDYRTINYFRDKRLKGNFDVIFTQVVELLHQEGFVHLDVQYIDGTKIESSANKYTFVWRKSIEKYDSRLKSKTVALLRQISENNSLESEGLPFGEELSADDFQSHIESIRVKLRDRALSREDKKTLKAIEEESIPRMQKYAGDLAIMKDRNSYSKTDPQATFMRMKEDAMLNGQLKPGYNVQISTENQFITNYAIYQRPTDTLTLIPYLQTFEQRYGRQSPVIVADSGYGSEQNYDYLFNNGIIPYVKYNMFHKEQKRKYIQNAYLPSNLYYNKDGNYYVCPIGQHLGFIREEERKSESGYLSRVSIYRACRCAGCPMRAMCHKSRHDRQLEVNHTLNEYKSRVRELLLSEEGVRHRSKRPVEPEAVFGQIKECGKFRRFRLKGISGANLEFGLKALAHNLRKMAEKTCLIIFFTRFYSWEEKYEAYFSCYDNGGGVMRHKMKFAGEDEIRWEKKLPNFFIVRQPLFCFL